MYKVKAKRWMNRLARTTKAVYNTQNHKDELEFCRNYSYYNGVQYPEVHVYKGLHEAANLLGLEVTKYSEDDGYEWYGTIYKGVFFYQLEKKGERK